MFPHFFPLLFGVSLCRSPEGPGLWRVGGLLFVWGQKNTNNNVLDPCELLHLLTLILNSGRHWFEKETHISLHVILLCTARY